MKPLYQTYKAFCLVSIFPLLSCTYSVSRRAREQDCGDYIHAAKVRLKGIRDEVRTSFDGGGVYLEDSGGWRVINLNE